jgi:Protein of unknown function (DUF1800)
MENSKTTRRQLFRKLIVRLTNEAQEKDPLFEKYSRKIYNGRRYAPNAYENKTDAQSMQKVRVTPVTSGLATYNGQWTSSEWIHLLKRTGYGFKKADLDKISTLNLEQAVNLILTIDTTPPAPPVNFYETDENNLPYGADWTNDAIPPHILGFTTNLQRSWGLSLWTLGQALHQDITIREKMAMFWYHFIPIGFQNVLENPNCGTNSARICYYYMKNFRDNATGNFKKLIRNIATQPAMMYQLNNNSNQKGSPDENFAREIMELFTIGKDVPNVYTQSDVVEAAKVLTGWRVGSMDDVNIKTNFVPDLHDTSDKQFSAFFSNTVIKDEGDKEIDTFIDMLFTKSEIISQYICRRLYRFFVYYDIDDNIEANVIKPLAKIFVDSNWEILPVLNSLFKSQHFYDIANRGVYIKSPFDLVVGFMRTFINYTTDDPTNYEIQYRIYTSVTFPLRDELQQTVGVIPNIAGWQAFYQKPSFYEFWINSNTVQIRSRIIRWMMTGYNVEAHRIQVDCIAFVRQFSATIAANPNLLVDECVRHLLSIDLSTAQKNSIKTKTLLSNLNQDYYWTDAWNDYLANPTDVVKDTEVRNRLYLMILTIVELAEYQLM